jgi:C1A family cysteine protease
MCWGKKKKVCPEIPERQYGNLPNNALPKMKNHRFGWMPDRPDVRDIPFKKKITAVPIPIPDKVDLRAKCSEIQHQGDLGACTAFAIAGNLEYLDNVPDNIHTDVSRLFIYYNERLIEGNECFDSGAFLRDGIKTLVSQGYCYESAWSYDIKNFNVEPPASAYAEASKHKISSYLRLYSVDDMLNCLAEGYPFVFGFTVYTSFESKAVSETGEVPIPDYTERVIGGHAVCAVGYDKTTERFLVKNSWGTGWGNKGYFTMPFRYMSSLADDFWTIRKAT